MSDEEVHNAEMSARGSLRVQYSMPGERSAKGLGATDSGPLLQTVHNIKESQTDNLRQRIDLLLRLRGLFHFRNDAIMTKNITRSMCWLASYALLYVISQLKSSKLRKLRYSKMKRPPFGGNISARSNDI